MSLHFDRFIFEGWHFDAASCTATFRYSFDGKMHFQEVVHFDVPFAPDYPQDAFLATLEGYFFLAGISYYKTALPQSIEIKGEPPTPDQATFFDTLYRHGLGEFLFQNNLSPERIAPFPYENRVAVSPPPAPHLSGCLVPFGGGKDSLLTQQILKDSGQDITLFMMGDFPALNALAEKTNLPFVNIRRRIDPQLFELNAQGAYNGHVPLSAFLAFLGVATALAMGKKYIVLSNEASANEPNTFLGDMPINHQYSKSLAFEQDFQHYVRDCISPDAQYFSLLRPLSEYRIAELFCTRLWDKYAQDFASCNRNFTQGNTRERLTWCGRCPKCAFCALLFSAFVPPKKLWTLFGGENLFAVEELQPTFSELLGLSGHKPFECVGEREEIRYAWHRALASGHYPELLRFSVPKADFDPATYAPHAMPEMFERILNNYIDQKK